MIILGFFLAVLTILAAGAGVTLLCTRSVARLYLGELLGASWLIGAGVVSASLAIGGLAVDGPLLLVFTFLICSVLGLVAVRCLRQGRRVVTGLEDGAKWERWTVLLALAPIVYLLAVTFRDALAWDGLLIWESKARHAFLHGGSLPGSYFANPNRLWTHPSYPLYLPYTELWVYLCAGDCHQGAVKALLPLFQIAAVLLVWSAARRLGARIWAASVTTGLILFVPTYSGFDWGLLQGYSDMPLAALYLAAVSMVWAWRADDGEDLWPLAAVCAGLLLWVKQEGLLLWMALMLQALVVGGWRSWKRLLWLGAPGVIVGILWRGAVRLMAVPDEKVFYPLNLTNLQNSLPRFQYIIEMMGLELMRRPLWNLLWFFALAALIGLAIQRRREALLLAIAVLFPLSLSIVPYLLTRLEFQMHVMTSFTRLALQVSLVAVLGIGLAMEWRGRTEKKDACDSQ